MLRSRGTGGDRTIAAEDLFEDYLTTSLGQDEVIRSVRHVRRSTAMASVREVHAPGRGLGDGRRRALVKKADDGSCEDVRIGLTHMAATPLRASAAESALRGGATRRRLDRGRRRARRGGHGAAGRPERDARLQAPPGARAHATGARGGSGALSLDSPAAVQEALAGERYLADRGLSVAVFLAVALEQPLLLEGEAGVGKTEVGKALAAATGARLIRLQCHEGIDLHNALYDWDYARQLLHLRGGREEPLYSERFLLRRPLLDALQASEPVVFLIDEIDRADDEFEAFLLEFLSDFQVSIPSSARSRGAAPARRGDLEPDARAARCAEAPLPLPLDRLPVAAREAEIVHARLPGVSDEVAGRVCAAVARLRREELYKLPGVGERRSPGRRRCSHSTRASSTRRSAWRSRCARTSTACASAASCATWRRPPGTRREGGTPGGTAYGPADPARRVHARGRRPRGDR